MRMALGREKLVAAMEEQNGDEKELSSEDQGKRDHTEDLSPGRTCCVLFSPRCATLFWPTRIYRFCGRHG